MIYMTGATGRIGGYVYDYLSKKVDLVPVVRKPSGLKNEVVSDFSEESLGKILRDATAIIHLAGSVRTYDKRELWKTNVELTRAVAKAAPAAARIVHASSISVYGKQLAKKPADESTPVMPDSDYSRSKYEGEKIVSSHANSVILRIGTVYGPFEDYRMILEKIKKQKMFIIGDGGNIIPFVHVEDAAAVFLPALKALPGVYNIVGGPITQNEVYAVAAEQLGVEPPKKHVSYFLANLSAWLGEKKALLSGGKPKITREHIAVLYFDRPFDCSRAKKELGFSPRKTAEGVRQVAGQLQKSL